MGEFDHIAAAMEASPITAAFKEMGESNDFSRLDKNAAKRHHFLSQFMLREFAHTHDGKDCLFQMEVTSRRGPRRVEVRKAASRHRLYSVPDEEGKMSNRNEGFLALIEDHAAPALRHLVSDPASLSPGERATIAIFVAVQTMRTPAAAEQVTTVANMALQTWAREFYSDREAFAERHREFFGDEASEEEIEEFRRESAAQIRDGRLRLSGRAAALSTGLTHAIEYVPMLIEFDWTLLQAPGGGFVTSDCAYAIHDPAPRFPWAHQGLLSSEKSETTVPLGDTACLLMRPMPMGCGLTVKEASTHEIETINLRTYGWAQEYVFGRTQDALVGVRKAARRRPADVVRPKPLTRVALIEPDQDDNSLAEENLRRHWPPQLWGPDGRLEDYVVIPCDEPHPELWARVDELVEHRARKRAGVDPDAPFEGRVTN
jgi:Protein of unknown function (DUF4238)